MLPSVSSNMDAKNLPDMKEKEVTFQNQMHMHAYKINKEQHRLYAEGEHIASQRQGLLHQKEPFNQRDSMNQREPLNQREPMILRETMTQRESMNQRDSLSQRESPNPRESPGEMFSLAEGSRRFHDALLREGREGRAELPLALGGPRWRPAIQNMEHTEINAAVTKVLQGYDWNFVPVASK